MDLDATPEERLELEYATQHFGFTPDSFTETIADHTLDILSKTLDDTNKQLAKLFRKKVSAQELDECFAVIKNRYVGSTERILDNFSKYVKKNCFVIPKNTVLPEDRVSVKRTDNRQCQDTSYGTDILSSELYTGDDLKESVKGFERQCKNVKNNKYKEAVLRGKLKNLETVAIQQRALLKKAEALNECRNNMDNILEKQLGLLTNKIGSLKKISNYQKYASNDIETGAQDEQPCRPTIKRTLETVHYEESIMAMKCRKFEKSDGYSTKGSESTSEESKSSSLSLK